MPKNRFYLLQFLLVLLVLIASCNDSEAVLVESEADSIPGTLPMTILDLNDLSSFDAASENWSIVGGVLSDFKKDHDLTTKIGKGILVNQVSSLTSKADISTLMEHGDMLLELDFLVPKSSVSNFQFMSRYGLQITDGNDVDADDLQCGSIVLDKDAKGKDGVIPPAVNAARAPGLWQTISVLFRAPKFDMNGIKKTNAKFEYVHLNGFQIHENVELKNSTLGIKEVDTAPFKIESTKGVLAIKNIKYKTFEPDSIRFSELSYDLYDGEFSEIPDYSTMTPVKSGTTNSFTNMTELSGSNDGFAIVYKGGFSAPKTGDYLIESIIDDGGTLIIDDSIHLRSTIEGGGKLDRSIIYLKEGNHNFVTSCYAFDRWATRLVLNIEGPNQEKRSYLSDDFIAAREKNRAKQSYDVDIDKSVEMIRGFVDHKGQKITHTLSVGNPEGIHYSYDTRNNALLNVWKGKFADVSQMWVGRGAEQKLKPQNSVLSLNSGIPVLGKELVHDPKGFRISDDSRPIFHFVSGAVDVIDDIKPNSDKTLMRKLQFDNQGSMATFRIAEERDIVWLNDTWASIGNLYHLSVIDGKESISLEQEEGLDQLLYRIPEGKSTLSYEISW